jgi:hypothetical protein
MKEERNGMIGTEWQVVDHLEHDPGLGGYVEEEFDKRHAWCKEFNGLGKFYIDEIFGLFYFERDEDRMMFMLKWGGHD